MAQTLQDPIALSEGTTLNILHYNPNVDAGSRGQLVARFSAQPPQIPTSQAGPAMHTSTPNTVLEVFSQQNQSPPISRPVSSSSMESHPWKHVPAQVSEVQATSVFHRNNPSLSIKVPGISFIAADSELEGRGFHGQITPRSMTDFSNQCSPHGAPIERNEYDHLAELYCFEWRQQRMGRALGSRMISLASADSLMTPPLTPGVDTAFQTPIHPPVQDGLISHQQHPSTDFLNFPPFPAQTPNPPLLVLPSQPLSTDSTPYSPSIPITIGDRANTLDYTGTTTPLSAVSTSSRTRPLESALSQQSKASGLHNRSKSSVQRAQICQNPRFSSVTETLSPPDEDYRVVFHGGELFFPAASLGTIPPSQGLISSTFPPPSLHLEISTHVTEPFPSFTDGLEQLGDEELTDSRSSRSDSSSPSCDSFDHYGVDPFSNEWPEACEEESKDLVSSAFNRFTFPIKDSTQSSDPDQQLAPEMNNLASHAPIGQRSQGASPRPRKMIKGEANADVSMPGISNEAIHPDLLAQGTAQPMTMTLPSHVIPATAPMTMADPSIAFQVHPQSAHHAMHQLQQQQQQQQQQQHQMQYQMNAAPIAPMSLPTLDHNLTPYNPIAPVHQSTQPPTYPIVASAPGTPTDIPRPPQNHHTNHSGQLSLRGRKSSLTHDPTKIYGCDHCERRFRRQEHLKRHVRTVHENAKPFPCPECGKIFGRNDNLKQHMRTHGAGNQSLIDPSAESIHGAAMAAVAAGVHPYGPIEGAGVIAPMVQPNNPVNLSETLLKAAKMAGGDESEHAVPSSSETFMDDSHAGAKRGRGRGGRGGAASTRKPAAPKRKREVGDVDGQDGEIMMPNGSDAATSAALNAQVQSEIPSGMPQNAN